MRGRDQRASHRSPVAAMSIGVEHEIAHSRCAAGVERLFDALGIKRLADGRRTDNGDRFSFVSSDGKEAGCFACWMDCLVGFVHLIVFFLYLSLLPPICDDKIDETFSCSTTELQPRVIGAGGIRTRDSDLDKM